VEPRLLPLLGANLLVPDDDGACSYFDRESRLCAVQRDHGERMLPGSCYQFPRRALVDDRGTFVALSNFCPTAAGLLCESEAPFAIVRDPAAFPGRREYEGLDARGHWPPLVRPGLLFDLESYSRWERFIVSTLASGARVDHAVARIAAAAEMLRAWTPDRGPFEDWATSALDAPTGLDTLNIYRRFRSIDAYDTLRQFVPAGLAAPASPPRHSAGSAPADAGHHAVVCRYLASRAFGSWAAYESRGIRTLVAEILVSELVLRVECKRASQSAHRPLDRSLMIDAIRQSDLFLIHLIDRPRLIEWLGSVEVS
jgi:hypothetical protein